MNSSYSQEFTLDDLSIFNGNWIGKAGGAVIYESWKKESDSSIVGEGGRIVKGDTVFIEQLKIELKEDIAQYIANVAHNQAPVPFRLISREGNHFVFENKEHDFPNRIGYHFKSHTKLNAYIEGTRNSKKVRVRFNYKKS